MLCRFQRFLIKTGSIKKLSIACITIFLSSCTNLEPTSLSGIDYSEYPDVWSSYLESSEFLEPASAKVEDLEGLAARETGAEGQSLNRNGWWQIFNVPVLDALIEKAVVGNLDLAQVRERVREARLISSVNLSQFTPNINANGSINSQNQSETSVLPVGRIPSFEADNVIYSAGFDASWEIDLFGRKDAISDINELRIQSSEESQRDMTLSLTSEIARIYFQLRALEIEATTLQKNIELQSELLELTQIKQEHGEASDLDIERSQIVLGEYEASLFEISRSLRANQISLAILAGEEPSTVLVAVDENERLPQDPKTVPIGITSEVLRRRPDVRVAERNYILSARESDLTRLSIYPSFSLFGSLGPETIDMGDFLVGKSIASTLRALLNWSLYDGGRQSAEEGISQSRARQAELAYRQSILTALEDVELAGTNYIAAIQTGEKRKAIVDSRQRIYEMTEQRYNSGTTTLLDVLNSQTEFNDATLSHLRADLQRVVSLISLYKALGGGWDVNEGASIN